MTGENCSVKNVKIAYVGGGSHAWAWVFMNDLAKETALSGTVRLYDIDAEAAENNRKIGTRLFEREDVKGNFKFETSASLREALTGADFVVISILPGTFDEMESDVHLPERYGIYQSVGDTAGPGGLVRALRTIPMYVEIAEAVKRVLPPGLGDQLHEPHVSVRKDPVPCVPADQGLRLLPRGVRDAEGASGYCAAGDGKNRYRAG